MGTKIRVLDTGFVQLIRAMGSEADIGTIAAMSRGGRVRGREHAEAILRKLLRRGEESPLEFATLIFRVRCPIAVARQWMRHRIGSYCERSLRHVQPDEYYVPSSKRALRAVRDMLEVHCSACADLYEVLSNCGVPKELARMVLPLSTYTEFYWSVNLRSLMNFLRQRLRPHAQYEMRCYAYAVARFVERLYPNVAGRLRTELGNDWPDEQDVEVQDHGEKVNEKNDAVGEGQEQSCDFRECGCGAA